MWISSYCQAALGHSGPVLLCQVEIITSADLQSIAQTGWPVWEGGGRVAEDVLPAGEVWEEKPGGRFVARERRLTAVALVGELRDHLVLAQARIFVSFPKEAKIK